MPKNVLFFHPFDPFPTASGTQLRCIQMLDGLREFGYETTLLHRSAIREGPRSGPLFRRRLGYTPRHLDTVVGGVLQRIKWWRRGRRPATQSVFGSPGMRLWFRRAVEATSPDILWVSYAFCDNIVDHRMTGSMLRINDSNDLSSLHTQVYLAAVKYFPHKLCPAAIPDFAISEDFYRRLDIQASPDEFEIFDKYQQTIAISPRECEIIRANVRTTRVSYIPMTLEPRFVQNTYCGPALQVMHGYPINLQGHHYFVTRVMPQVRRRANDFSLEVVGNGCNAVPPGDGVLLRGFVEDLRAVYARARFLVMPVFGVTGQQIRIVEAMANGLPVVALRAAAEASPIRHGFNGLVADNAAEFAEHVLRLWREPETCRKMGAAARETIATEFSRERLLSSLAAILS